MGGTCSKCGVLEPVDPTTTKSSRQDSPDPAIYDLMRRSVRLSGSTPLEPGQQHLLFRQQKKEKLVNPSTPTEIYLPPTRLLVRRHSPRHYEEGLSGTHIYAVRYPSDQPLSVQKEMAQEQAQPKTKSKRRVVQEEYEIPEIKDGEPVDTLFRPSTMAVRPKQTGKSYEQKKNQGVILATNLGRRRVELIIFENASVFFRAVWIRSIALVRFMP